VTNCTEVKMVPFNSSQDAITPFPSSWYTPGLNFVFDDRIGGVPDPTTRGPAMIQIGTEGGLLPAPAVIKNQPVNYTYNRRNIVVLNVQEKALFLGPAERADVIVDFSDFAGKTLILYNDAPAPVPAADQRIDYFTGTPDQTDTGGAPPTLPGYGPNTRTIMQIVVGGSGGAGTPDYVNPTLLSALQANLPAAFAASQDPVLVPQAAYNPAYGTSYTDQVGKNLSSIQANSLAFPPLFTSDTGPNVNVLMQSKAIQELFELDYGRMNATLGVELPFTNGGNQTTLPMGYIEPATEIIDTSGGLPAPVQMDSLGNLTDGTQIWKITHNGVDTHAIHVHLFNAQVVNRVGWDGAISKPDANELGWKETIRMNPLEDIIIALRPTTPQLPFGLPISRRLMSPADPPGIPISTFDTQTGNPTTVANDFYDFGWEYVWHCHLLGHEENDMMRPTVFNVPVTVPDTPSPASAGGGVVTWTDPTPIDYANLATTANLGNPKNEIGFRIARSVDGAAYAPVGTTPANATSFIDTSAPGTGTCTYDIVAYNAAGDSTPATTLSALCSGPLAPIVSFTGAPPSAASGASFTVTAVTNSGVLPTITSLGACSVGAVGGTPTSATASVTMNSGSGTCNLTANWPAAGAYLAATATQTTIATLAAPTVTFTGAPASAVYNSSFTVAATTNATTTAVITSSGACTNSGTTVTMISGTGTCNLTASWPADLNYASATLSQSTTASKAASSVATFTSNPATSVVGQPVRFDFTVTGIPAAAVPTGTVTVTASTGETCNGTLAAGAGSCASTFVTTGSRTMTASYGGDANYSASTATRAQAVGDFAMGVSPGSATVNGGQKATYTLTVTSLGGFTGPVALTCPTGLPAGFTCTIAPTTVTPNGGAKNATVTVTTVKGARTLTLTFTGKYGTGTPATGGLTHAVSPTLTVRK
jgi:FtsP/CotA-like multicopper oxidase with cupredoxin domain